MDMRNASKPLVWTIAALALSLASGKILRAQQDEPAQVTAGIPQVGGRDVVTLARKPARNQNRLQFLSLTLFPGRGMNVFQITANLPGKGVVQLLKSPSIVEAAGQLNGTGPDEFGNLSHSFGAAFLIPFSSRMGGELSPDGKTVNADWHGHAIHLPMDFMAKYAVHGLINQTQAENLHTLATADGETMTGVIHAGDFRGHWLSNTDLYFTIALTGQAVEVTVTAKNVGHEPEPMAIGWHPYLAIPSGDRSQARVHIPAATRAEVDSIDGRTTGRLVPVNGTSYDFQPGDGALLKESMNTNFSHLTRTQGVVDAWLSDPKWNYGIRVEGLSPEINTVHLYSPNNNTFAAIEEQFNFQDPFGEEWKGMNTGMVTLRPGESTTWKVRLVLFAPNQR
jgi:aldose 1-epimerase